MRLTTLTDYSMRLLMHVARHPDRLCTIAEIAETYDISAAHLMKVTHQLGLAGWIETVRGKGGGMRLAHAPEAIRLGDVVRSVEPDFRMVECFDRSGVIDCRLDGHCRLSGILGGALQDFLDHLDRYTLADILPPPASSLQPVEAVLRRMR